MGYGSYKASDWTKLKTSRKIETATTNEIFTKKLADDKFLPKFFDKRLALDSEEHPESTPIMIGVDVTGSMGYLSTQIIKESLNELMMSLYSNNYVSDPQLLFGAIGDAVEDRYPLQVTQFEADIRIAEQLMDLYLENMGGDIPEDYELMWYFAYKKTQIDSYDKRSKKGYCFTIGDADCHLVLDKNNIKKIFNDNTETFTSKKLADLASEKFELFHIYIDGSGNDNLDSILPGRIISINKFDIKYLPEIIITAILMSQGVDMDSAIERWNRLAQVVVRNAVKDLVIEVEDEIRL